MLMSFIFDDFSLSRIFMPLFLRVLYFELYFRSLKFYSLHICVQDIAAQWRGVVLAQVSWYWEEKRLCEVNNSKHSYLQRLKPHIPHLNCNL